MVFYGRALQLPAYIQHWEMFEKSKYIFKFLKNNPVGKLLTPGMWIYQVLRLLSHHEINVCSKDISPQQK